MDRATLSRDSANTLHCALELSKKSWLLAIQFPDPLYQPTSRREFDAPSNIFARGPDRLVVCKGVTAIQPIKLVGEASPSRVRQPRVSGCSQRAV